MFRPTPCLSPQQTASKSALENDLGCKNKDDAIVLVLQKGDDKTAKGIGRTKEHAEKKWVGLLSSPCWLWLAWDTRRREDEWLPRRAHCGVYL